VLVYIDMLGYPVDDVAAILKVRPGTVKSRASRARRRLAARLTELGLGEIRRTPDGDGTGAGNPELAVRVEPEAADPGRPVREEETRG
jgi:RNA polymerase sigma-70 factor, ECF subfamily